MYTLRIRHGESTIVSYKYYTLGDAVKAGCYFRTSHPEGVISLHSTIYGDLGYITDYDVEMATWPAERIHAEVLG